MIDGIKINVVSKYVVKKLLTTHPFRSKLIADTDIGTGEVIRYKCKHNGWSVTLQGYRIILEGSLHKFYTGGSNTGDFNQTEISLAIYRLCLEFGFVPSQAKIMRLEAALNLSLNCNPHDFIDALLCYRNMPFNHYLSKGGPSIGKYLKCSQNEVKFYNKSMQCKLKSSNVLRYELKASKAAFIKPLGLTHLSDLFNSGKLQKLFCLMLEHFEKVSLCEPSVKLPDKLKRTERELMLRAENPCYWDLLGKSKSRQYVHAQKSKYERLVKQHARGDMKADVRDMLIAKAKELLMLDELTT
jgi:hypothetical protein